LRHLGDSLDQYPATRDRFWSLLHDEGVLAYFCSHTHNYSAVNVDGVWQVDAGHARGAGDAGAPSTFVVVHVDGGTVIFDAYRDKHDGTYDYDDITHRGTLAAAPGSAEITGPTTGLVQSGYVFTVTVSPVTATLPITYVWQAADPVPVTHTGRMSLQDTQTFTWTTVGPKEVAVTAANVGGTATHTHVITIYTPVQASFTALPTSGVEPLTVGFTNTSSGDYVNSLWAFGDGVTSTLQSPTHTYTTVAVYTVTLTVSGPGGSDTETKAGYITVRGRPSVYLPLVVRQPEVFRARRLAPKIATIRSESG